MNAPVQLQMTKPDFLRWLDRQDRKYEWKEGRVVQMTNVTKAHARIVSNIIRSIGNRLDPDRWSVTASDLGVEDEDFVRFPDVIVEPMDDDDKGRRARSPVILIEVLSPSSVGIDFTAKREEYARFPTLAAYIVVSQDEAIVWGWSRTVDGSFPANPTEIRERSSFVPLPSLMIDLPVAEVYRGIAVGT